MKIVVDHLTGSRRGQRQEFELPERVRFGRHPDNDVAFDAHRDLDASSRHAELRREEGVYLLCDVGSSNGTYVEGRRITHHRIAAGVPVVVEFGEGGPRLRIFLGNDTQVAELPKIEGGEQDGQEPVRRSAALLVAGLVLVAAVVALIWWRFVG